MDSAPHMARCRGERAYPRKRAAWKHLDLFSGNYQASCYPELRLEEIVSTFAVFLRSPIDKRIFQLFLATRRSLSGAITDDRNATSAANSMATRFARMHTFGCRGSASTSRADYAPDLSIHNPRPQQTLVPASPSQRSKSYICARLRCCSLESSRVAGSESLSLFLKRQPLTPSVICSFTIISTLSTTRHFQVFKRLS